MSAEFTEATYCVNNECLRTKYCVVYADGGGLTNIIFFTYLKEPPVVNKLLSFIHMKKYALYYTTD